MFSRDKVHGQGVVRSARAEARRPNRAEIRNDLPRCPPGCKNNDRNGYYLPEYYEQPNAKHGPPIHKHPFGAEFHGDANSQTADHHGVVADQRFKDAHYIVAERDKTSRKRLESFISSGQKPYAGSANQGLYHGLLR